MSDDLLPMYLALVLQQLFRIHLHPLVQPIDTSDLHSVLNHDQTITEESVDRFEHVERCEIASLPLFIRELDDEWTVG